MPVYIAHIFLFSVIGIVIYNILDIIFKFKCSLFLHLSEMDTDPDRHALNADPTPDPVK